MDWFFVAITLFCIIAIIINATLLQKYEGALNPILCAVIVFIMWGIWALFYIYKFR
ncbi:hypothetical protein [Anaerofustis butyriciformans]|uniref:hypothetical protein n=1 Tax=Anaerofustis butyriciformans TaxID=3108533 RepID=UPI002E36BA01|nr:hypothetical protein [Anaerofustis sp. HA2171]